MSNGKCPFSALTRRSFFKTAGKGVGMIAASTSLGALTAKIAEAASDSEVVTPAAAQKNTDTKIPFHGEHQAGITTPQQGHTYFIVFDLVTKKKEDVIQLFKDWTAASQLLTEGKTVKIRAKTTPANPDDSYAAVSTVDSGEAVGLSPARLTLTFGLGAGLFVTKEGVDRYGLSKHRPEALVDLPKFHGDELVEANTGGDLSIQACSDDPQVAFHAVRQLARFATDIAQVRWVQTGFLSSNESEESPRNLMGFKDGTQQPKASERNQFVWVSNHGHDWMQGGTYLVARRIRIALEHWDGTDLDFQEKVIGRSKSTGAPLGQKHEREVMNLTAVDADGNFIIPENAHVRLAAAASNGGSQMLRRGYSYNEGVNFTAERWPPWRQGMEYDAGLFFLSYQSDPRTGFIKVFQNMAKIDALNQFVTHVGSGLFACPPGVSKKGEYIGQKLFEKIS
jgi:deferrochelatase/peroxidase EfeB